MAILVSLRIHCADGDVGDDEYLLNGHCHDDAVDDYDVGTLGEDHIDNAYVDKGVDDLGGDLVDEEIGVGDGGLGDYDCVGDDVIVSGDALWDGHVVDDVVDDVGNLGNALEHHDARDLGDDHVHDHVDDDDCDDVDDLGGNHVVDNVDRTDCDDHVVDLGDEHVDNADDADDLGGVDGDGNGSCDSGDGDVVRGNDVEGGVADDVDGVGDYQTAGDDVNDYAV